MGNDLRARLQWPPSCNRDVRQSGELRDLADFGNLREI